MQGAAESDALGAPPPSVSDLEYPLLEEVFKRVNRKTYPSLRLVCKRWKAVLDSLQWVWNPFNLRLKKLCSSSLVEAEAACWELQHLLAANASVPTSVAVTGTLDHCTSLALMDWDIAEFLYILNAATGLASLTISCPVTAPTLRAIASLRSLNELCIQPGATVPLGCRPAANIDRAANYLTELINLEALELCCSSLPPSVVNVATKLTRLTELRLCYGAPLPPSITELTALSRLGCLELCEGPGSYAPVASWPGVLNMRQLSHAIFQGLQLAWGAAGVRTPFRIGTWPPTLSLTFHQDDGEGGSSRQLSTLDLSNARISGRLLRAVQQQLAGNPQLGLGNFYSLQLRSCRIEADWAAAVAVSGMGGKLQAVVLNACFCGRDWEGAGGDLLGVAVSQLTALTRLWIQGSKVLPSTLAAIASLQQLRVLSLLGRSSRRLFFSELPDGPYLSCLQLLLLSHNAFKSVPACLASATQLRRLDMSFNQQLLVTSSAVELLAGLPLLHVVNFSRCCSHRHGDRTVTALIELGRRRPDIEFRSGRGRC